MGVEPDHASNKAHDGVMGPIGEPASAAAGATALIGQVAMFIDSRSLIARGDAVVVGVSGGADSVALLAVLGDLARQDGRDYRLTVAHLDHSLRESSARDAEWVASLAESWSLPFVTRRCDVQARARDGGDGLEAAARDARYQFLLLTAESAGANCVAVAHHAGDNVETVLHRIIRGTHLKGLAAIQPMRELGRGVRLIRPLLCIHRAQIEDHLRQAGLRWLVDETNSDTTITRNFIRHELLPLLRDRLNPRVDQALLRLASAAGQSEELLADLADRALEQAIIATEAGRTVLRREALSAEPRQVQCRALRLAAERLGAPMGRLGLEQIEMLRQVLIGQAKALDLPDGLRAVCDRDRLVLELRPGVSDAGEPGRLDVALQCPGRAGLDGERAVVCEIAPLDQRAFDAHCKARPVGVELIDADTVVGPLRCKTRRDGMSFVPLGAPGRQSVGDFLTNLKLSADRRRRVLCVCDDLGPIYVAPLRIDDRVKITDRTRNVLRIEVVDPA